MIRHVENVDRLPGVIWAAGSVLLPTSCLETAPTPPATSRPCSRRSEDGQAFTVIQFATAEPKQQTPCLSQMTSKGLMSIWCPRRDLGVAFGCNRLGGHGGGLWVCAMEGDVFEGGGVGAGVGGADVFEGGFDAGMAHETLDGGERAGEVVDENVGEGVAKGLYVGPVGVGVFGELEGAGEGV